MGDWLLKGGIPEDDWLLEGGYPVDDWLLKEGIPVDDWLLKERIPVDDWLLKEGIPVGDLVTKSNKHNYGGILVQSILASSHTINSMARELYRARIPIINCYFIVQ